MFSRDLLKGRAIFLTGGGTGLGRATAIHFAKLGARLFLIGRREAPLKDTCEEIHREGGAAAFTTCDIRDFAAVESAFASAEMQFGEVDTLVNNAAGNFMARTERLSPNAFNAVVGIVLKPGETRGQTERFLDFQFSFLFTFYYSMVKYLF